MKQLVGDTADCKCDCGKFKVVWRSNLLNGKTTSCGCARRDWEGKNSRYSRWPEFAIWTAMKQRCNNPKTKQWKDYGGRGIKVCRRWEVSFKSFIDDVGRRPAAHLTIDRINNDGNYEPGNVKWSTRSEQQLNRRVTSRAATRERR